MYSFLLFKINLLRAKLASIELKKSEFKTTFIKSCTLSSN